MVIDPRALERVVCIANGKGGVAKTSLAANLSGLAAAAGYRTLVVDLDPQGDLSDDLGYYDDARDDRGRTLVAAMLAGQPLTPTLTGVRPLLDVVTGGVHLAEAAGTLLARSEHTSPAEALARALSPLAREYDLVVVDTPPVDTTLQQIALGASRWLLIPTKADASSIRGIQRIAQQVADSRHAGRDLDILGVVLVGVPTSARRVRASAISDISAVLGDSASLLPAVIRSSDAVARECRARGILVHELAEQLEGAEPFWRALREGGSPQRLPGTAPALAEDYVRVVEHVLLRLSAQEMGEGAA